MGKKLKIQKKNSSETTPKTIDFSSLIKRTKEKLAKQNFPDITLNTIKFDINPSESDLDKQYFKKYKSYLHEEFNFKIIKMFFNYIASSKVINPTVKDNRPFLIDFLKIITNLLMNEIDLSAMAYLLEEKVKWIKENETDIMWNHLYNVCLRAKQITSSNETFELLINILDKKNPGFKAFYKKWIDLKQCKEGLKINFINEKYNELIKLDYLNQNNSRFINYNEAVNKILEFSQKPPKKTAKKKKKKITNKQENNNIYDINNTNNEFSIYNSVNQVSQLLEPNLSFHNPVSPLTLVKNNSNENLELNMQRSNNNLASSRNFNNYYNNNYFNLNMGRNDSGISFNSSFNEQNN